MQCDPSAGIMTAADGPEGGFQRCNCHPMISQLRAANCQRKPQCCTTEPSEQHCTPQSRREEEATAAACWQTNSRNMAADMTAAKEANGS